MINYNPASAGAEANRTGIKHHPQTCFVMTKLGDRVSDGVTAARGIVKQVLEGCKMKIRDAESTVTGGNLQLKIWQMMLGVPLGIAIIDRSMSKLTFGNIFYELGVMQAYGKAVLIIKMPGTEIPSDFAGTEYIEYDDQFHDRLQKFMVAYSDLAGHYEMIANNLSAGDPLLSIDYLRRAYLINGDKTLRGRATKLFRESGFDKHATDSVARLLIDF